jgi:hypothetical protein
MPVGEVGILADPHRDLDPTESHLRTDLRSFASVAQCFSSFSVMISKTTVSLSSRLRAR